jgi:hypothetical protein
VGVARFSIFVRLRGGFRLEGLQICRAHRVAERHARRGIGFEHHAAVGEGDVVDLGILERPVRKFAGGVEELFAEAYAGKADSSASRCSGP